VTRARLVARSVRRTGGHRARRRAGTGRDGGFNVQEQPDEEGGVSVSISYSATDDCTGYVEFQGRAYLVDRTFRQRLHPGHVPGRRRRLQYVRPVDRQRAAGADQDPDRQDQLQRRRLAALQHLQRRAKLARVLVGRAQRQPDRRIRCLLRAHDRLERQLVRGRRRRQRELSQQASPSC
jgi:hypothetical protein